MGDYAHRSAHINKNEKGGALHRKIGKISYVLVPLLLISIFLVGKESYRKEIASLPQNVAIADIALNIPSIIAFAVLYSFAILNKKRPRTHMRYMLATSLLLIGPGLGRALITNFNVPFWDSVTYTYYVMVGIPAILLLFDIKNRKPLKPYIVTLIVLLFVFFVWQIRLTSEWQTIGVKFAKLVY